MPKNQINGFEQAQQSITAYLCENSRLKHLPLILQEHIAYANPYKITHAHGVFIEQSGKQRSSSSSKWKKIKSSQNIEYPRIEFTQKIEDIFSSIQTGIENNNSFFTKKSFGINKIKEKNSDELLQSCVLFYLSSLVWMPWAFASEHVLLKENNQYSVSIALAHYPDIWGEMNFSEEARILSFNSDRYQLLNNNYALVPWRVEFGKYNIKKSYKLPTQVNCFWGSNEEEYMYLSLEKVVSYTVK